MRSGAAQHKACAISAAAADLIPRRGRLNNWVLVRAEEIALADLDAGVAQKAVGGCGVEVEVRQRERAQELLALHGDGLVGAGRERDVFGVGALELLRLERFHVVDGLRQALLQLRKAGLGVRVEGTSLWVSRAQPLAAKSLTSWICFESGSMSGNR